MTTETRLRSDEGSPLAEAARNVADQAGQTVQTQASTAMDQLATAVEGVAQAIRRAGSELREEQPQVASVADTAAGQVERMAQYLETHEPRDVLDTLEETARRQPALVIGGGIALGLVLGRLLRSATPMDARPSWNGGGRTSSGWTGSGSPMTASRGLSDRPSDLGDTGASVVTGTRVVRSGGTVDTGSTRRSGG